MKKALIILFCCLFIVTAYSPAFSENKLSIVCTNFPAYDFCRELASETAEIRILLPPGSEIHSYEPSPQDIISIQQSDLFVYTGGESDTWVENILSSMGNEAPVSFRMMSACELLSEEISESMESEAAEEEEEADEHIWTSPLNVMRITSALSDVLSEIDRSHAAVYEAKCDSYALELEELDRLFRETVIQGKRNVIIFGDRFPFRYFVHEYGLEYDAAFPGCSEDSEPSVKTIASLIEKIRSDKIPIIFYIEFSSRRTADILAEETGAEPKLFHSCHNVSADEMNNGATYLTLMRQNAAALREALN